MMVSYGSWFQVICPLDDLRVKESCDARRVRLLGSLETEPGLHVVQREREPRRVWRMEGRGCVCGGW